MKSVRDISGEEIMELPRLGLDDTFEFRCKACGKCCKHREDVILTPYDMFRIARHLHRTPEEIFIRYCHMYEGVMSHLPVVRIVPIPPDNACPFLMNKRCVVHNGKPVVCRVYPLARVFETEGGGATFINSGSSCTHESSPITVRDWIGDVASNECETAGSLWRDIITTLYESVRPDKLSISDDTRQQIVNVIFTSLYLNYDTNRSFIPQLQSNFEAIKILLDATLEEVGDEQC